MQRRLAHRGPDGFGTWGDAAAGVGLAHRRLSIIDLSTAASQPMHAVSGRYVIVFNGEIYNFKSLVPELRAKGYVFNENSDTAVLAPLFDLYGIEMLQRLEGMFAFAIWDAKTGELFVARDHLGIKPLYYTDGAQGFAFASELKALVGLPGVDESVDRAALAEYVSFLWTPGERTMMNGIKKLRPGHCMKIRAGGKAEVVRWYWPPQALLNADRPVYDLDKSPEQLLGVFDFVVKEQCLADVPVGAFLSGGVDSSAIVASMAAQGVAPAMTYCIGFGGAGMEREGFGEDIDFAKDVARRCGVKMKEVRVDAAGVLDRLPGLATMLDEPCADPAPLFVADICAQARADGLKVLLSGTGGDDVMSGYRRHVAARLRQRLGVLGSLVGVVASGVAAGCPRGALKRRLGRLGDLLGAPEDAFLRRAFMTNSVTDAWTLVRGVDGLSRNDLDMAMEETAGQDVLNRMLYMELFGFLPDHNLNYGDKAGMAEGVEIRVPFTDRRILDFMADVLPTAKMRGLDAKAFFKASQRARLPEAVLTRSKTGFGAPVRGWLTGAGREMVEDTLLGPRAQAGEWFDLTQVRRLWDDTRSGKTDGAYAILAMCMACWWMKGVRA